jgi:hypothetical protein
MKKPSSPLLPLIPTPIPDNSPIHPFLHPSLNTRMLPTRPFAYYYACHTNTRETGSSMVKVGMAWVIGSVAVTIFFLSFSKAIFAGDGSAVPPAAVRAVRGVALVLGFAMSEWNIVVTSSSSSTLGMFDTTDCMDAMDMASLPDIRSSPASPGRISTFSSSLL